MPAPTLENLELYVKLDRDRKVAEATAESCKKQQELIATEIRAWLAHRKKNSITSGKFVVNLIEGARYPKWKDEYIKEMGAEAAEAVKEATPPSTSIKVVLKESV